MRQARWSDQTNPDQCTGRHDRNGQDRKQRTGKGEAAGAMGWVLDQAWRRCVLFHDLCPPSPPSCLPCPALPTDTQTSDAG